MISILFVDAVSADDIVGSKASATPSARGPAATRTEAEQQTESRLQEAIARRQAEIRRQYSDPLPSEE